MKVCLGYSFLHLQRLGVFITAEHFFPEIKLPSLAMRLKKTLVFVKDQNKVISCVEGHALRARRLPFFFRALEHCVSRTQQVIPALYG